MSKVRVCHLNVVEICAGAGGQSLGLEQAGFRHCGAIDVDVDACLTLRRNRPNWPVAEEDISDTDGSQFKGIDLLAAGLPCPPFSIAGKQLGSQDERNLFPQALRLVRQSLPTAVLIENVRGLAGARFAAFRRDFMEQLTKLGYETFWKLLNASDYGVPQLRPRFVLVALKPPYSERFHWPLPHGAPPTVGETLRDLMASRGWLGASDWAAAADTVAPTIVGGSKKHGGPDLGPTRAREQWRNLRVDGLGIADFPPGSEFPEDRLPRLTTRMVARLQGFPDTWLFAGSKTAAYRQVGNAFPPPVARAVGQSIRAALQGEEITHPGQISLPSSTTP